MRNLTRRLFLKFAPTAVAGAAFVAPPANAAADEDLTELFALIAAHNVAMLEYDECSDADWEILCTEIGNRVDATRDALLDHRPRSIVEVRAKASFMANNRAFCSWDDIEIQRVIRSLIPI